MVDPSKLEDLMAATEKRYKRKVVMKANEHPNVRKISTGSLELDLATYGGFPMGRMVRPWGGFSSAKSMSTWRMIREAQKIEDEQFPNGIYTVWYDVEGAVDPELLEKMGIDSSRVYVFQPSVIEDIGQFMFDSLDQAHIHVIDSVAHAYGRMREEKDLDDHRKLIGLEARTWTPLLKQIENKMSKDNMVVMIDQVRKDFGGMKSEKEASSTAFDHASSLSLHHKQSKKLYRSEPGGKLSDTRPQKGNDALTGGHRVNGYEIEVEVNKSRVCKPYGKARLVLDLDTMQFDSSHEYLKAGLFLKVIEQSGSYYKLPGYDKSIQGEEKLKAALEDEPFVLAEIDTAAQKYMAEQGR
jgi:RecA/RadA recombinase